MGLEYIYFIVDESSFVTALKLRRLFRNGVINVCHQSTVITMYKKTIQFLLTLEIVEFLPKLHDVSSVLKSVFFYFCTIFIQ